MHPPAVKAVDVGPFCKKLDFSARLQGRLSRGGGFLGLAQARPALCFAQDQTTDSIQAYASARHILELKQYRQREQTHRTRSPLLHLDVRIKDCLGAAFPRSFFAKSDEAKRKRPKGYPRVDGLCLQVSR